MSLSCYLVHTHPRAVKQRESEGLLSRLEENLAPAWGGAGRMVRGPPEGSDSFQKH